MATKIGLQGGYLRNSDIHLVCLPKHEHGSICARRPTAQAPKPARSCLTRVEPYRGRLWGPDGTRFAKVPRTFLRLWAFAAYFGETSITWEATLRDVFRESPLCEPNELRSGPKNLLGVNCNDQRTCTPDPISGPDCGGGGSLRQEENPGPIFPCRALLVA